MMILVFISRFIQSRNHSLLAFLFFPLLLVSCVTPAIRDDKLNGLKQDELYRQFELDDPRPDEVFRVFVSSDNYIRKQLGQNELFVLEEDVSGDLVFKNGLSLYDKIDFKTKAIVKVSLHKDSGSLSRVRFLRSSGISEIDKIVSEELTRWSFDFLTNKIPAPFEVSFYILLKNQITKDQAKEELKKHIR